MATSISVTGIKAPNVSNLTASEVVKGVKLEWDDPYKAIKQYVEIWRATTNNRASATKVYETISDTWIDTSVTVGSTYYYWIRAFSIYGRTDGDWEPTSSTAGESITVTGVDATTIDNAPTLLNDAKQWGYGYNDGSSLQGTTRSSTSASIGSAGTSTGNMTVGLDTSLSWNTWTTVARGPQLSFSSNWYGWEYRGTLSVDWDTPTGTTGDVELLARIIMYNVTDSTTKWTDVAEYSLVKMNYDGSNVQWGQKHLALEGVTWHGIGGSDAIGDSDYYDMRIQLKKVRSDSGTSWDPTAVRAYLKTVLKDIF